tara:strand:- start:7109 stop:9772 length:2664 start_codon:yes stop_codon:yes gene_type:complete
MAIKRYISNSDTTITNAFKSDLLNRGSNANMGQSDILEMFSIYAQSTTSSLEQSRILMKYPIADILADRNSGAIPSSGSVNFYLRVFNAEHGQSVPKKYYADIAPIAAAWDEGHGLDMEGYLDNGSACWVSSSDDAVSQVVKVSFLSDTRASYGASKHVSVYNGRGQRQNYWFKTAGGDTAPTLTGTEYEVDIQTAANKAAIASTFKYQVNLTAATSGITAAFSGSSTSVVLLTNDVLNEVSEPVTSDGMSAVYTADVETFGKSAHLWEEQGGDIYKESNVKHTTLPVYSQYFEDVEDLEVDVTSLVEEWLTTEAAGDVLANKATAEITFSGQPTDGSKITLVSTNGKSVTYNLENGTITGTQNANNSAEVNVDTDANTTTMAAAFAAAVRSVRGHRDEIIVDNNAAIVRLTQSLGGFGGNRKVDSNGAVQATFSNSGFFNGGVGLVNNGMMLKLSGSYEDGSLEKTFYTKKFFARGSEFFFKRPMIEARFDDSKLDDRGNFHVSSSLISGAENMETLYLYNNYKGTLRDIPTVTVINKATLEMTFISAAIDGGTLNLVASDGTSVTFTARDHDHAQLGGGSVNAAVTAAGAVTFDRGNLGADDAADALLAASQFAAAVNMAGHNISDKITAVAEGAKVTLTQVTAGHTGNTAVTDAANWDNGVSGTTPANFSGGSGGIYLRLFDATTGDELEAKPNYPVTGGWDSTGIYTASFALETTASTVQDIWLTEENPEGGGAYKQIQYYTGSFSPVTYGASMSAANYDSDYVLKITNLRSSYTIEEKPRFRVYTRKRNWQPNIYTVARNAAPINIIENSYYKITRESDNLDVIDYGTGSVNHTRLSYDMSGSYFDLDMSLLETGYSYMVSLVFKLDGVYKEQNEKFKFRVE